MAPEKTVMTLPVRLAAIGAMLGGTCWTVSWLLNVSLTDSSGEGTRLGFSEGEARAILNPAILLFLAGVWATRALLEHRLGRPGTGRAALIAAAGLALLLAGNVMEFGLKGTGPIESEDPGFAVFSLGLLVTLVGLALFAVTAIRAGVLSRWEAAAAVLLPVSIIPLASFGLGWLVWGWALARAEARSRS